MGKLHELYMKYRKAVWDSDADADLQQYKAEFEKFLQDYHNPLEMDKNDLTVLAYAANENDIETVTAILRKIKRFGMFDQRIYFDALEQAINQRAKDILQLLCLHGANINTPHPIVGYTHMEIVAGNADLNLLAMLLPLGAEITVVNEITKHTVLQSAFNSKKPEANKIKFINCLLFFASLKDIKPDLSGIEIAPELANQLVLINAVKDGVPITIKTLPGFINAFTTRESFMRALKDRLNINIEPLYLAAKCCYEADSSNEYMLTLAKELQELWRKQEEKNNPEEFRLFSIAKKIVMFKSASMPASVAEPDPQYTELSIDQKERVDMLAKELVICPVKKKQ